LEHSKNVLKHLSIIKQHSVPENMGLDPESGGKELKIIKLALASFVVLVAISIAATAASAEQISKEPIPDISINEDEPALNRINLNDYFSNDNTQLYFSSISSGYKTHVVIHDDGYVDFFPPKDWFGSERITFVASDGEQEASDTILLTVLAVNDKPIVLKSFSDLEFYEDNVYADAFNLNEHFTDIDSTLDFSYQSDYIFMQIDDDGYVDFTAPKNWHGSEEVELFATDGEYDISERVSVTVISMNDAPEHIVNSITLGFTGESTHIKLDLNQYFIDPDHETLDYEVSGYDRIRYELDSEKGELILSAPEDWSGEELLTITARDTSGDSSSIQVVVIAGRGEDSSGQMFYLFGLVLALAIAGVRLQMTGRGKTTKSPVKLSSYRHYKGR
jgi:hypothetical protein